MSARPPRLYDSSRKPGPPPSERQKAARDRNWQIFKLRGLWYQVYALTEERRELARLAIDAELLLLGAEDETSRRDRLTHDRERYERFRAALIGNQVVH